MEKAPKRNASRPSGGRSGPPAFSDRNKRELTPNLSETHKLLTAVQFGDRAALLVRKRMSLNESGQLPASRALSLLEQYDTAISNYVTAVNTLCKAVGIDSMSKQVGRKKTTTKGDN